MPHITPPPVAAITSNPLENRADMVKLLHSLLSPLHAGMSSEKARIRIGHTGTHFDDGAAQFEGFARALWGLAPLMAASPDEPSFATMRKDWGTGIINGSDPEHEEYWGHHIQRDQRFVEMAAVGVSLCIAPHVFWEPLPEHAKKNLNKWMLELNGKDFPPQNWRFFRIMANLGLKTVGAEYSQEAIDEELDFADTFYGDHGFPSDGAQPGCLAFDYYATSFAIPFYGLIYARLCSKTDPERAAKFRQRAIQNIPAVVHLFAPSGAAIPFGRSMIYRFACACFWAAVAFDELSLPAPFTWGVIKGLLVRNIRWFTQKEEVFYRDGSMSIGWTFPNMFLSEDYNSAQSPYWALKSFLVLALPESHPFWAAKEEPYPTALLAQPYVVQKPWMQTFSHAARHTFVLSSGQFMPSPMRGSVAKYGKFAYSAEFGFSVPTGPLGLQQVAADSMLALSDDPEELAWVVRRKSYDVEVRDNGVIKSSWKPYPDTVVTTWLVPPPSTSAPYHTRIHRITTSRALTAAEGGFAIHSQSGPGVLHERRFAIRQSLASDAKGLDAHGRYETPHSALAVSRKGVSGTVDLLGNAQGKVQDADGCSNVISPRTVIPTLMREVEKGESWMAVRVFALPFENDVEIEGWVKEWKEVEGSKYKSVEEVFKATGTDI